MLSIKKGAANEYYLGCAYNDDEEIFFGATDKNLPATIKKAVTGKENDIMELFGGRRKVGIFMIDFTMFEGNSALMIESACALYTNIGQSIPLAKAEGVAKDLHKLLKSTVNLPKGHTPQSSHIRQRALPPKSGSAPFNLSYMRLFLVSAPFHTGKAFYLNHRKAFRDKLQYWRN